MSRRIPLSKPYPDYQTACTFAKNHGFLSRPIFDDARRVWIAEAGLRSIQFVVRNGRAELILKAG